MDIDALRGKIVIEDVCWQNVVGKIIEVVKTKPHGILKIRVVNTDEEYVIPLNTIRVHGADSFEFNPKALFGTGRDAEDAVAFNVDAQGWIAISYEDFLVMWLEAKELRGEIDE